MPYSYGPASARPMPTSRRALQSLLVIVGAAVVFISTAFAAWAADNITITFVRHGESLGNTSGLINTEIPGPGLTPEGQTQSGKVAQKLMAQQLATGKKYDAIYASDMIRTQQTAEPFQAAEAAAGNNMPIRIRPGLHEVQAGIFEGKSSESGLSRIGYALIPVAWIAGMYGVPMPGSPDANGAAFQTRFTGAVDDIYNSGAKNPVAFAHGMSIMAWTLMNVDNPDITLMISHPLNNTDIVDVTGNPTDGWTMNSWAGQAVSQNPNLATKLFVDARKVLTTSQMALYNVRKALASGDSAQIRNAIKDGLTSTVTAALNYPGAVIKSIVKSVQTGTVFTSAPAPGSASAASVEPADDSAHTLNPKITALSLTAPKSVAATDASQPANTAAAESKSKHAESRADKAGKAKPDRKARTKAGINRVRNDSPRAPADATKATAGADSK